MQSRKKGMDFWYPIRLLHYDPIGWRTGQIFYHLSNFDQFSKHVTIINLAMSSTNDKPSINVTKILPRLVCHHFWFCQNCWLLSKFSSKICRIFRRRNSLSDRSLELMMGDRKGKIGKSLTLIGFVGIGIMTKTLLWAKSWSLPPPLRVGSPHFKDRERQPWESLNKKLSKHVKKQMALFKWSFLGKMWPLKGTCEPRAQKTACLPFRWVYGKNKHLIYHRNSCLYTVVYSDLSLK